MTIDIDDYETVLKQLDKDEVTLIETLAIHQCLSKLRTISSLLDTMRINHLLEPIETERQISRVKKLLNEYNHLEEI